MKISIFFVSKLKKRCTVFSKPRFCRIWLPCTKTQLNSGVKKCF